MEELKCTVMDEPIVTAELAEPAGAIGSSRRLIFSSGVKLGLVIAIVALAGNEALYYFVPRVDPGFGHWVPLTNQIIYLCVLVWLTASLALASIWLGIGKWPLYVRFPVALAACAVAPIFERKYSISGAGWSFQGFVGCVLETVVCAAPFGLMYLVGYELHDPRKLRSATPNEHQAWINQFSIKQLLEWTVVAAVVLALGRAAQFSREGWTAIGMITPSLISASIGTVCMALAPRRTWASYLCLLLSGLFVVTTACVSKLFLVGPFGLPFTSVERFIHFVWSECLWAIGHASLLTIVFLLYRRLGYRLRRRAAFHSQHR